MKVTIERVAVDIDSSCQSDVDALLRLFPQTAVIPAIALPAPAEAEKPEISKPEIRKPEIKDLAPEPKAEAPRLALAEPKAAPEPPLDAEVVASRGRAMTKAAKDLGAITKEPVKLTAKQKGKVAAEARWAKVRAEKARAAAEASQPGDPSAPSKPKGPRLPPSKEAKEHDYSLATEEPLSAYPAEMGAEMILMGANEILPYPDGRELLEGTFAIDGQPAGGPEQSEDEHVREIERIAREHGALPG